MDKKSWPRDTRWCWSWARTGSVPFPVSHSTSGYRGEAHHASFTITKRGGEVSLDCSDLETGDEAWTKQESGSSHHHHSQPRTLNSQSGTLMHILLPVLILSFYDYRKSQETDPCGQGAGWWCVLLRSIWAHARVQSECARAGSDVTCTTRVHSPGPRRCSGVCGARCPSPCHHLGQAAEIFLKKINIFLEFSGSFPLNQLQCFG